MLLLIPFFPDEASRAAGNIDALFFFLLAVCGTVAIGVILLIIYFCIKYRRRSEDQQARQIRGNNLLEIVWTVIPFLIFTGIFFWGAKLYFALERPPANAQEVYVIGKQWMWKFEHPGGQREINQLHVPLGRPIKLMMVSQDVIHSFFVPDFRLHKDLLPGRYTITWFEATKTGRYNLFCSQYCGTNHSQMVGEVIVMEPGDFKKWLNEGPDGSLASEGQKLFRKLACDTCHRGDSESRGPVLEGLFGRQVIVQNQGMVLADENYIRESILDPTAKVVAGFQPIMPTFKNQVDEEQLSLLVAYIKSLASGREQIPPVSSPTGPQPAPVGPVVNPEEGKEQR